MKAVSSLRLMTSKSPRYLSHGLMTLLKFNNTQSHRTYYLESLGCRLNAAEIEDLARRFAGAGGTIVTDPAAADIIVLNTCAVTAHAAYKSQRRINKLHAIQPEAGIAILGCWATEDVTRALQGPGVKWVLTNSDKSRAVETITGAGASPVPWAPGRWGHTRAFLAVQDGCDHLCTYCLTQVLRGPARSRPLASAVSAARDLVAHGAQEVVLTGVSLGAYGRDLGIAGGLSTLVGTILHETDVPRLRLSSIEPWDIDEDFLRLWENPRLCRQLHLPLQSGSDTVLRRMGRRITTEEFGALIHTARTLSPEMAITTDVMVGFPGETEDEFMETQVFIQTIKFAKLHVFPYSERKGTAAVRLPGSIPKAIRRSRADQLRKVSARLGYEYRERMVGQTVSVLYISRTEDDHWGGLTDTYVKVMTRSSQSLYNSIIKTTIIANTPNTLVGRIN